MTIARLQYYRKKNGYSYKKVAELSGIPLSTVQKVLGGHTKVPRQETMEALEKLLIPLEKSYEEVQPEVGRVQECSAYMADVSAAERGYTVEDYYAVSQDRRVELIDGKFYDMAAPSPTHQIVSGEIWNALRQYISDKHGKCVPLYAPVDVQLEEDDSTMVQPDVMVVCDRRKITGTCIQGAPDFIAEVLSRATRKKDMTIKLAKYQSAGVKEYWMIDIEQKRIFVYLFGSDDRFVSIYGLSDTVPINIYNGDLTIDFQQIIRSMEGL